MKIQATIAGFALISLATLTGCHTVQGTVQGAGKDIQTVATAVTPTPTPTQHRRHTHHKKTTITKTSTIQTSQPATTSQTTSTSN